MKRKVDAVLARVREPETLRPVGELGLVSRVRFGREERALQVFLDIGEPRAACLVCGVVTNAIRETVRRLLGEEFSREFPELTVEIVG